MERKVKKKDKLTKQNAMYLPYIVLAIIFLAFAFLIFKGYMMFNQFHFDF